MATSLRLQAAAAAAVAPHLQQQPLPPAPLHDAHRGPLSATARATPAAGGTAPHSSPAVVEVDCFVGCVSCFACRRALLLLRRAPDAALVRPRQCVVCPCLAAKTHKRHTGATRGAPLCCCCPALRACCCAPIRASHVRAQQQHTARGQSANGGVSSQSPAPFYACLPAHNTHLLLYG
jgi:hypothetical protein